jgi:hypothetical protein
MSEGTDGVVGPGPTRHRLEAVAAAAFMTAFVLVYHEAIIRLKDRPGSDSPLLFLFAVLLWSWLAIGALVVNAFLPKGSGPRTLSLAVGTIVGLAIGTTTGPCWADPHFLWAQAYHHADCFMWVAGCTFTLAFVGARAVRSREMSALRSAMFLVSAVAMLVVFLLFWLPSLLRTD